MLGLEDGFSDGRIVGTKEGLVLGKSLGLNEGASHDGKYKTASNCLFSSSNCNKSILISTLLVSSSKVYWPVYSAPGNSSL